MNMKHCVHTKKILYMFVYIGGWGGRWVGGVGGGVDGLGGGGGDGNTAVFFLGMRTRRAGLEEACFSFRRLQM